MEQDLKTTQTRKHAKTSKATRRVIADIKKRPSDLNVEQYAAMCRTHRAELQENELVEWVRERPLLLDDLANNLMPGWESRFLKRWYVPQELAPHLFGIRDAVRRIWSKETPTDEAQRIVQNWIYANCNHASEYYPLVPDVRTGNLLPRPDFLIRVGMAILTHYLELRVCGNPSCPEPYFLAKRKTQKFCERGSCTQYAQSQYALKSYYVRKDEKQKKAKKGTTHGARKKK